MHFIWIAGSLLFAAGIACGILGQHLFGAGRQMRRLDAEMAELREDNSVMEMVVKNANDGLVIQDVNARILWSNPAYSRLTGYSARELAGRRPQELVLPPEVRPSRQELANFRYDVDSGVLENFEIVRNVRKDGAYFWNQLSFAVVRYDDGRAPKVIVIARDVTEQMEREEALKHAKEVNERRAEHDMLTSLANRTKLSRVLPDYLEQGADTGRTVGVFHVDLDHFKDVNDTLGHAAGDKALVEAARRMSALVRKSDLVCRFGGDEFIVALRHVEGVDAARSLAARLIEVLREPMDIDGHRVVVGASVGIALSHSGSEDETALMKQADIALYEVKNSGRNGTSLYNERMGRAVAARARISAALPTAIAEDALDVYMQPQLDVTSGTIVGFEALTRWNHPERGVLVPGDFFGVAERNGYMAEIDRSAMRKALAALARMHAAGHDHLRVAINAASTTLASNDYLDVLKWEVEQHGLKPSNIAIEVLETAICREGEAAVAAGIDALAGAGFAIELDDFGTGYSGLAHLTRMRLNGVKIDRALVRDLPRDVPTRTVVRSILGLCGDLGLTATAEGVETTEQAAAFAEIGGRLCQGYGIARPMPVDDALDWMATAAPTILPATGAERLVEDRRQTG